MTDKIRPFLWFDSNAEEAMNFYVSIFKNSKVLNVSRYPDGSPFPKGTMMGGTFLLEGREFLALNGGPHIKLNEAFSMFVDCESQEEVDGLWEKLLSGGGTESRCGWLKDRFGLSWQIIPAEMQKMMGDKDPRKAGRVVQAMMQMAKIDLKKLREAYAG